MERAALAARFQAHPCGGTICRGRETCAGSARPREDFKFRGEQVRVAGCRKVWDAEKKKNSGARRRSAERTRPFETKGRLQTKTEGRVQRRR